eukprot:CAMPEP_0201868522 /NCGR_PEP_ID=MMETSP0902-20130614/2368_1 /ASSEMBLY_ACC=CAM_ASM_000551 /TAXON_ID=420261 /ORGANISM="Thalassiosira antarctica, Strain CCMP982" /LENGTH=90 /DNA_ID=CAMNT_0048393869 /DNA_START=106 /DNA_END=378 /DNA_ORIENTATION=+
MARLVRRTPVAPPRTRCTIRAGCVVGAALGIVCGSAGIAGNAARTRGSFDVAGVVVGAPVAGVGGCVAVGAGDESAPDDSLAGAKECRDH